MPNSGSEQHDPVEASRMTIGEHLDELRGCVLRCITALVVAALVLAYPAKYLLSLIIRPAVLALRAHGQPENLLQTSPTETMIIYLKVVLIGGVVLASPYILFEIWRFVAAGLYPHEKRWVTRILPYSIGLFLTGVAFMYGIVLLVALNFLIGFGEWIPLPQPEPNRLEKVFLKQLEIAPETDGLSANGARIQTFEHDPPNPPPGSIWFNATERKLKLQLAENETVASRMELEQNRSFVTTHFKIGDYLTFVLSMTIAFGLAFQVPLVVLAITRLGVMTPAQLAKYRPHVILVILIVAGLLAPPELISHMLLSIPMILLFEAGLLLARRQPRKAR